VRNLQVEKKDGSLEEFDRGKIARGVQAAGLSAEDAESLAAEVETWAGIVNEGGVISVARIREKVLELLDEQDPEVAQRFREYKK